MRIEIVSEAENDLLAGANFYNRRGAGLGEYFLDSLYSDIDSLLLYAGVHREMFGFHRALSADNSSRVSTSVVASTLRVVERR
jgi:hypothetical protein